MGLSGKALVTGGAGFVGSSLSAFLKRDFPDLEVIALDNLSRRGSELNLARIVKEGIQFHHGDVRNREDLESVGPVDYLFECSAEPSVHAGYGSDPSYLIQTNLVGAINCLEHLRRTGGTLVFLSTSRVYPIDYLRALPLEKSGSRFVIPDDQSGQGWSVHGISESFPLDHARSLYGATKLSAELLITEYQAMYNLPAIVNRCGVLTGPWQMGKVDQGFVTLWLARHIYDGTLSYMGFGGGGYQVRDILHVADLYDLLLQQLDRVDECAGQIFNVGGGHDVSVSLAELTALCQDVTGKTLEIGSDPDTRDADIPYYVSDCRLIHECLDWRPRRDVAEIVGDIHGWIAQNKDLLRPVFGG